MKKRIGKNAQGDIKYSYSPGHNQEMGHWVMKLCNLFRKDSKQMFVKSILDLQILLNANVYFWF